VTTTRVFRLRTCAGADPDRLCRSAATLLRTLDGRRFCVLRVLGGESLFVFSCLLGAFGTMIGCA
jgi:hypothetical protein